MILTNKQEEGLRTAVQRYNDHEAYTCIAGYAGSGKSTLVSFIIDALGLEPYEVAYVAYTGKAASVLQHKGCPNAKTAHKLLFYSKKMPDGSFVFRPREKLDGDYKLIVVDEVSMLPGSMWRLLLTFGVHVLACGDPFQLPPVSKEDTHDILDHPHVFLSEVMRQAQDSGIIRLSMDIREGRPITYRRGDGMLVIPKEQVIDDMYYGADQILCGTNKMRDSINKMMRAHNGFGPEPQAGDKIICLENHWDKFSLDGETSLVNGTIGYLQSGYATDISYPLRYIKDFPRYVKVFMGEFKSEDEDEFGVLTMDYKAITEGTKTLTPKQEYAINNRKDTKGTQPYEFNYGYAITTHRAQGSQWNNVMVIEERFPFDAMEHKRWLYTAITRAADRCILVH